MRSILAFVALALAAGAVRAADAAAVAGNYVLEPGHLIAIAEFELDPQAPHVLAFTDLANGRIGVLRDVGPDEFALPAALLSGEDVARIRFERRGGSVVALAIAEPGKPGRRAVRVPDRREEVALESGGTTLRATLWLPAGKGPFPAIVLVPAGALGRTAVATFVNLFLGEGVAVLAYDARPAGATFPARAADAVAAVDWLRQRREIDRRAIGLWGHSQGGWLSLLAAAGSPHVGFVIDHSGMLVPAWQQELYRLGAEAAAGGVAPTEIAQAQLFEARLFEVAQSGNGWVDLQAMLDAGKGRPWVDLVYRPASLDELRGVWSDDFSFDPRPDAAKVRVPVLALFGGLDRSTPIESASNLEHALGGRAPATIRFFPTANHAFLDATTGANAEIPGLSRFAPGMLDAIRGWLRATIRDLSAKPAR